MRVVTQVAALDRHGPLGLAMTGLRAEARKPHFRHATTAVIAKAEGLWQSMPVVADVVTALDRHAALRLAMTG